MQNLIQDDDQHDSMNNNNFLHNGDEFVDFCMNDDQV